MKNSKNKALIRLIVTIVLTINAGLTLAGINPIPFDETMFTEVAVQVAAGLSIIWSWWKNANITTAAQLAQNVLTGIREDGVEISEDEAEV